MRELEELENEMYAIPEEWTDGIRQARRDILSFFISMRFITALSSPPTCGLL